MTATATRPDAPAVAHWLTLPYPPSTNHLFATFKGRRIKSAKAKAYAAEAGMMARLIFPAPLEGRLQISIVAYPGRGVGQDLDNLCKATLDALTGVVWHDDSQVWRLTVERAEKRPGGGLAVCVEAYRAVTAGETLDGGGGGEDDGGGRQA